MKATVRFVLEAGDFDETHEAANFASDLCDEVISGHPKVKRVGASVLKVDKDDEEEEAEA